MTHLWEALLIHVVHHDDLIVKRATRPARAEERRGEKEKEKEKEKEEEEEEEEERLTAKEVDCL